MASHIELKLDDETFNEKLVAEAKAFKPMQNQNRLLPLIVEDAETGEKFTLNVSQKDYGLAMKDQMHATKLLHQYKRAVAHQSLNALSTSMIIDKSTKAHSSQTSSQTQLMQLKIYDEVSKKDYTLWVTQATYDRANKDLRFATELLNQHITKKIPLTSIQPVIPPVFQNGNGCNNPRKSLQSSIKLCTLKNAEVNSEQLKKHPQSDIRCSTLRDNCDDDNEYSEDNKYSENSEVLEDEENSQEYPSAKGGTRYQWANEQILLLLALYKENQDELNQNKITHRKFWQIIVNGLKCEGYTITVTQCSIKIDTLKRKYKSIVDHNAQSGNDRKTCEFYDLLDEIFRKKPWIKPLSVAGSNIPMDDMDKMVLNSTCKTQKNMTLVKLNYLKQNSEDKRLRREATAEYRHKKLKLMSKLVDALSKK